MLPANVEDTIIVVEEVRIFRRHHKMIETTAMAETNDISKKTDGMQTRNSTKVSSVTALLTWVLTRDGDEWRSHEGVFILQRL